MHFDLHRHDYIPKQYSIGEQATNAIYWIKKLSTTCTKQQSAFLGGSAFGYNIFGYACKLFKVPHFPDEKYSPYIQDILGLHDECGTFSKPLEAKRMQYNSLESLTRFWTFRRMATFMKKTANIRAIFTPEVAEIIAIEFHGKRIKRFNNIKDTKKSDGFIKLNTR